MRSIPRFTAPNPRAIIRRRRLIDFGFGLIGSSISSLSDTAMDASSRRAIFGGASVNTGVTSIAVLWKYEK